MNFGNCCIGAPQAHTSIRKFSKENLTVKVSGDIVDAHLIPMKFLLIRKAIVLNILGAVASCLQRTRLFANSLLNSEIY